MDSLNQTAKAGLRQDDDQEQQYLLFQSNDPRIGIEVEYVVETIINHSITRLPLVPDYVRGVINLRGEVIPIVDIRLRLGQRGERNDSVIVINVNDTQMGILVDQVDQMVKLPKRQILPVPERNEQKLICGMSSLPDGGVMLVLDCPALLET